MLSKFIYRYIELFGLDPEKTGLVYIRHPWESGLDNSPNWDRPLGNIPIDRVRLPAYRRKDLTHTVPAPLKVLHRKAAAHPVKD